MALCARACLTVDQLSCAVFALEFADGQLSACNDTCMLEYAKLIAMQWSRHFWKHKSNVSVDSCTNLAMITFLSSVDLTRAWCPPMLDAYHKIWQSL